MNGTQPQQPALEELHRLHRRLDFYVEGKPPWMISAEPVNALLASVEVAAASVAKSCEGDAQRHAVPLQVHEQRLARWRELVSRGTAIASTHPALATVLKDARWVLHRYARHFGGQARATRDLGRLVSTRTQLVSLTRRAQLLKDPGAAPALLEEVRALPQLVEFLIQEQGEVTDSVLRMGRYEQAHALTLLCASLEKTWVEVIETAAPVAHSPLWAERTLQSGREVLEMMGAVRHANLPDEFEDRRSSFERQWTRWEASKRGWDRELADTEQAELTARRDAACQALLEQVWTLVDRADEGPVAPRRTLNLLCDKLDQALDVIDHLPRHGEAYPARDALVDALLWCGRQFDEAEQANS